MQFIATDGSFKAVTLEQVGGDVFVRVDGMAVVSLRAEGAVLAVSKQATEESGLAFVQE